jgi:hypothetical protein
MIRSAFKANAERMAGELDEKRGRELLNASLAQLRTPAPLKEMYGDFYGSARDIYGFSYRADGHLLKTSGHAEMKTEPVELDGHLKSLVTVRTAAGLWVHGCDRNGLTLWHSPKQGEWQRVSLPDAAADPKTMVHTLHQFGDELFLAPFNDYREDKSGIDHGLYVLNLETRKWRRIGAADGLGGTHVARFVEDPDRNALILYGGGFRTRYEDGKCFLSGQKIPGNVYGACGTRDREFFLIYEEGLVTMPRPGRKGSRRDTKWRRLRKMLDIIPRASGGKRCFNAGRNAWRRLTVVGDKVYCVTPYGLLRVSSEGKPEVLWYPEGFYYWSELGAFVEGNCPLPPADLKAVIPDDRNPNLLWLISRYEGSIRHSFSHFHHYYRSMGARARELELARPGESAGFITAFDTRTGLFSEPLKTDEFAHAEAFGDYLYLSGFDFRRAAKSQWKPAIPCRSKDQAPRVTTPDTPVGLAARAFFEGDRTRAVRTLRKAVDKGIAPGITGKMLKAVEKMK